MFNIKDIFYKLVSLVVCFSFALSLTAFAASPSAADKLEAGKKLYNEGKYDQAMDNFIDVFVYGSGDQISEANEYVNLIHFAMGGIEEPKRVPYSSDFEQQRVGSGDKPMYGPTPSDTSGLEGYSSTQTEDYPYGQHPQTADEAAQAAAAQAAAQQPTQYYEDGTPVPYSAAAAPVASDSTGPTTTIVTAAPIGTDTDDYSGDEVLDFGDDTILVEDSMPEGTTEELRALRKERVDAEIASYTKNLVDKLNAHEGVNVYMRGGMVDAIDIKSDLLFAGQKPTFRASSKALLDDVYALMLVSGVPSFILLPEGSYTDDVSIHAVRHAIALNSYLINMGLSSAKINFNMGLTTEEPPVKFSNLEGISIVFDYTVKPNLKIKLAEKGLPPVASLGMYPFESFTPGNNEGMLVDFSVVETSAPVGEWILQIIQHGKDGHFYVVRQVSGNGAVYQQIFWNGRKQYFGQVLPLGRYTIILRAKDANGKEKILRRKVTLLETQSEIKRKAEEAAAAKKATAEKGLNYESKRLWTKPSRTAKEGANLVAQPETTAPADPYASADPYAADPYATDYDPYATAMPDASAVYQGQDASAPVAPAPADTGYNSVNMPYPSQEPAEEDYDY